MNMTAVPETNSTETDGATMREYLEVMRAPADPLAPLRAALQSAIACRDAANQALAAADADVVRKQSLEAQYREGLEAAEVAINMNANIEAAEHLAEKRRVAEARLTAAKNMCRKSTDSQGLARAEVQAAERDVERAADAILSAAAGGGLMTSCTTTGLG